MLTRKTILGMTAASIIVAPMLAFGQANTGGSSSQPQTTQTTPQQGPISGTPAARDSATGTPGAAVPGPTTAQTGAQTGAPSSTPRDGTPGNPPSTATQRAADSATGERTPADGTPGNPPGTAAGRAMDRTLGTNTTGANPQAGGTAATTAGATGGTMAVDSMRLRDGRRASQVIGSTVYGGDGSDSIGSVDDLIVPREGGNPIAVLSVGGFLGIGAKLVAVPYERLQHDAQRDRWTLPGATKDALTALPTFAYASGRGDAATGADRPARGATGGGATTSPATRN